jgi:hypothetical protein
MTPFAALLGWLATGLPVAGGAPEITAPSAAARPPSTDVLALAVQIDPALGYHQSGADLVEHLRAELVASNVVVVAEGATTGPSPNARLSVGAIEGSPRAVALDVQYLRSGASVRQVVDLSSLPPDGAVLAIAIAVDELIRSSWSLAGVAALKPAAPAPSPELAGRPAPRPARVEARLLFAAERRGGGTLSLGPDVVFALFLGSRFALEAGVGSRRAESRAVPDGSIDSSAVTASLGATLALPARAAGRRAGAEVVARLVGAWMNVSATPSSGATSAHAATAVGVAAVGGLGAWVTLAEPLRLVGFAGWQAALRGVRAVDADRSEIGVYDAGAAAALGIGARF